MCRVNGCRGDGGPCAGYTTERGTPRDIPDHTLRHSNHTGRNIGESNPDTSTIIFYVTPNVQVVTLVSQTRGSKFYFKR